MKVAAGDGGWSEFHKRATVQGLPQIPDAAIAQRFAELIDGNDERVLLLGITRALARLGRDLTAVDLSRTQIERMWPGDGPNRRAVLGDWRSMAKAHPRYTAAIGDGSLSTLAWPDEYQTVFSRVANGLEPGGVMVMRCFIAPDERETVNEVVSDVLTGREPDWNAARWRLAMAASDLMGKIAASDLAAIWRHVFPNLEDLAERTGWSFDGMELLLNSFSRAALNFSFVTRSAVLDTLPDTFVKARFVPSGDYPLADRCPFLVAKRAN